MIFDNHPPIKLENCKVIAKVSRDGGSYENIGWNTFTVYQGKDNIHIVNSYNSGCDYGGGTVTHTKHLGKFKDLDTFGRFLNNQKLNEYGKFPWWASELLEKLSLVQDEG